MKTEEIKTFLNSMINSIDRDNVELFEKIIDSSKIKDFENPNEFFYAVLYPWEKFVSGFLKSNISSNRDIEFIWKHSEFIDRHFRNLFEKYEGSACCSDKSRTIVNGLLSYYTSGELIEFDYSTEFTYHLPERIFKSHDHIISLYEGLRSLLYGHPERYIKALKLVLPTTAK